MDKKKSTWKICWTHDLYECTPQYKVLLAVSCVMFLRA